MPTMKEHVDLISSDLPLAKLFNRILFKIETIRVMSSPRIFDDLHGEMATEKMRNFHISGKQIPIYISDGQSGLRQASFVEKTERKLNDTIEADNLGQQIYLIAQRMKMLTDKIKSYTDSERAFDDNKEMLNRLLRNVDALIYLRLDEICNLEVEC